MVTGLAVFPWIGGNIPSRFTPIMSMYNGNIANLNANENGEKIFLFVERDGIHPDGSMKKPITNISISNSLSSLMPSDGWTAVYKVSETKEPLNLNEYCGGRALYLLYQRNNDESPITDISFYQSKQDELPVAYSSVRVFGHKRSAHLCGKRM